MDHVVVEDVLEKAHVRSHMRHTPSGGEAYVREHEDSRTKKPEPVAQSHSFLTVPPVPHEPHLPQLIQHTRHSHQTFGDVAKKMGKTPHEVAGMVRHLHEQNPKAVSFTSSEGGHITHFKVEHEHATGVSASAEEYAKGLDAAVDYPSRFNEFAGQQARREGDDLIKADTTSGYNVLRYGIGHSGAMTGIMSDSNPHITYAMYTAHVDHGKKLLRAMHAAGIACPYRVHALASTVLWMDREHPDRMWEKDPEGQYEYVKTKKGERLLMGRSMQYVLDFQPTSKENAEALATFLNQRAFKFDRERQSVYTTDESTGKRRLAKEGEDRNSLLAKKRIDNHTWSVPDIRTNISDGVDQFQKGWFNAKSMGDQELVVLNTRSLSEKGFNASEIYMNRELRGVLKSLMLFLDNSLSPTEINQLLKSLESRS